MEEDSRSSLTMIRGVMNVGRGRKRRGRTRRGERRGEESRGGEVRGEEKH